MDLMEQARDALATAKKYFDLEEKRLTSARKALRDDRQAWDESAKKFDTVNMKERIKLDVGGQIFSTSKLTLTMEPRTYFSSMFSGRIDIQKQEDGTYFIDRDPYVFRHVLNHMRGREVDFENLSKQERHALKGDAYFFQIGSLVERFANPEPELESSILTDPTHVSVLLEWLGQMGGSYALSVLYRGSRDGFQADQFHDKADGQGPTVVLVRCTDGFIFGGYAGANWKSPDEAQYSESPFGFLFTMVNPHNIPPTKYPVSKIEKGNALLHNASHGPTFGGGHDLHIADNCNIGARSYGYLGIGYTDTTGMGRSTFTGSKKTFVVHDIEVLQCKQA